MNPYFIKARCTAVIMLAVFLSPLSIRADTKLPDLLLNAQQLMSKSSAGEAYEMLIKHEAEFAGDPKYDYILGVSALDSERAGYAVLAFQRTLAVAPRFLGARMDLARAYFRLGAYSDAEQEFSEIKQYNPPHNIKRSIRKYMDIIAKKKVAI